MTVLAHGVGSRADLPVPLSLAVYGAGLTAAVGFLAVVLLSRRSRLHGGTGGRELPRAVQRTVDSPGLRAAARACVLLLTLLVVAVALLGPRSPDDNLAPYALYVTLWVGLIPLSLLLGPVWAAVSPLRTLHALIARATGPAPAADRLPAVGWWPAAAALLCFAWLELVLPSRSEPRTVGLLLVLYGVAQLAAALWFGEGWFARADAFEVWSSLLGRLALVGRRADGRLVVRSPLDGVDGGRPERGLVAVVMVLLGSTGFDGLSRTQLWQSGPGQNAYLSVVPGTLGLLTMIGLAAALFVGATALGARLSGGPVGPAPGLYAHCVIPIVAGYAVAHYFSLLLLDGQATWILAGNPFGVDGVDLFGIGGRAVDYTAVSPRTIAVVRVGAVVLGHVLGVVLAHDRAVRESPGRPALGQVPLVTVMAASSAGGLGLLLSS